MPVFLPRRRASNQVLLDDLEAVLRGASGLPVEREYVFAPPRRYRFDLAIPALRIAVEIQGFYAGGHAGPAGFRHDAEKFVIAAGLGWLVFPVTWAMLRGKAAWLEGYLTEAVRRRQMATSVHRTHNPSTELS